MERREESWERRGQGSQIHVHCSCGAVWVWLSGVCNSLLDMVSFLCMPDHSQCLALHGSFTHGEPRPNELTPPSLPCAVFRV